MRHNLEVTKTKLGTIVTMMLAAQTLEALYQGIAIKARGY